MFFMVVSYLRMSLSAGIHNIKKNKNRKPNFSVHVLPTTQLYINR